MLYGQDLALDLSEFALLMEHATWDIIITPRNIVVSSFFFKDLPLSTAAAFSNHVKTIAAVDCSHRLAEAACWLKLSLFSFCLCFA